jgi:F0F1-type ATP synthase membrane subunit c/vacuolar-type H+-ATPase subunit K
MPSGKKTSLTSARWIVLTIYLSGLVIYPTVGALAGARQGAPPEVPKILPLALLGVSMASYVVSLVVERILITQAKSRGSETGAASAAIVTAAFGESFAIYGLVLTFAGAGNWAPLFYVLCLLHGVHLLVRWPSLEAAVSGDSYETE